MAKTFSILGDSISTFDGWNPPSFDVFYSDERLEKTGVTHVEQTWWHLLIDHFGGTLLKNGSFSGSLVEGGFFPAGDSDARADAILGETGEAPDAIVCFIGINDYGWGGAEAQAAGRSHAMPRCIDPATVPEQVAGTAPADAVERFGAAYRTMVRNIRTAAPEAAVYCITLLPGRTHGVDHPEFCYRLRGHHLDEYNAAIRDAAAAEGCRVADVRAFGRDYDSLEGTHPTNLGMRQFASMVVRAMQLADAAGAETAATEYITAGAQPEIANPALDLRDFCNAPESAQVCDAPTCIGCPHAANTGNQWLCRCLK